MLDQLLNFLPSLTVLKTYFDMGGFVMIPLAVVSILLWYALASRVLTVSKSRHSARELVAKARLGKLKSKKPAAASAVEAIRLEQLSSSRAELKSRLNEHLLEVKSQLSKHRVLVSSLVAVAPLLGLLGTVDGMIETFDSLGDMVLFSQSGGIAGGISKALFTTQMGLVISIPGLLFGKVIDRREQNIVRDVYQIRDLVCVAPRTQ